MILFTGSGGVFQNPNANLGSLTGLTIFVVGAMSTGDMVGLSSGGAFTTATPSFTMGSAGFTGYGGGASYNPGGAVADGNFHIHMGIWDPSNPPSALVYRVPSLANYSIAAVSLGVQ